MAAKTQDQDLVISSLKARNKLFEDKDRGNAELSRDDAPIKGRSMEIGEEVRVERSTELGSNDTEEMVNVLSSMEAVNILTSEVVAVSVPPVAGVSTVGVPTVSGLFPTVSAIFTIASVVTPYSRHPIGISAKDKGKEKVVKSEEPKKKKLQEQIDTQVAKEIEEEIARENQMMNEQVARDAEIARIHVEEELKMMIEGLDRSNEVIARHLQEYEQSESELTIGEKIDLIKELVKYQDHHVKILKYQAQQSKLLFKKEQREFYMSILRSHAGWKTKHFRGMTLEEIKEKKGLKLDEGSAKRMKTSEDVSEEDLNEMMQLVPVEEKIIRLGEHTAVYQFFIDMLKQLDREDLHQLWALVIETLSIKQASRDKEKELWVELKRLFEPDFKDQLWTHNQNLMHDPLDWRLYDTCGVHHVFTKDQEIFMLVERDCPLRRGLAIVMISNKLQFWSTARIKTTGEGTTILATIDGDDSQGEACPTISGLEAEQDRENIIKTSTLPHDSSPRVTSFTADEGSMQHQLNKLTDLCTRLLRQQTEIASKIAAQDLEIISLKARIKMLEDKDG
nr:hypothetical protein [Tanacetum cinerariifolium]GEZ64604.1 hypothetical protein [Tanacetum cinerariifolium]